MGQRSQIYIRITDKDNNKILIAKYFQWNFAERMISRARYGIEYIKDYLEYIDQGNVQKKVNKIFDINFDMKDIVLSQNILDELRDEFWGNKELINDYIFLYQDNNDGKLFIDCNQSSGEIKYCLTDYDLNILSPEQYMKWDALTGWQKESPYCKNNIDYINQNAKMMTSTELEQFIKDDYSKQIGTSNFKKFLKEFVEKSMTYNEFWWFRIEKTDDNGSWNFYSKDKTKLYMQYDNATKILSVEPPFKEDFYEGIIQDVCDFYSLPYEKNSSLEQKKDSEIDYDYE